MPKLIKDAQVVNDNWTVAPKDFNEDLCGESVFLPKQYWLEHADKLEGRENIGVWLDSDEGPEELAPYLANISRIAINFPKFVDGRGYSYARLLRERFHYNGEIRAIGDVLHDQLFYMKRCGFDAFAVAEQKDAEAAIAGLNDFSDSYQAACDVETPLFRRRN